jgi:hypothetical protein
MNLLLATSLGNTLKDIGLIGSSFAVLALLVVWWYWLMSRFGSF